ncbi:MAG TPA: DUF169 domain-containing protein [Anaerolineaceae bacterium]|nr:DUF169 domain-containing protein [Anaerolineaceae bacterium]
MQSGFKELFIEKWVRYFPSAPLPITFYYADQEEQALEMQPAKGRHCLIRELARVREGESLSFEGRAVVCPGGRYYLGFTQHLRPDFRYFLSCGIPGKMEGERYKASPELVDERLQNEPPTIAPAKKIVFKRWDKLAEIDDPLIVIFFARPDVLSGLAVLANYDEHGSNAVIMPFGSGCSSTIKIPLNELNSDHPHAILGMFDVSARPWVPPDELTLSIPFPKFVDMVANMDESFLITESWNKIKYRIEGIN